VPAAPQSGAAAPQSAPAAPKPVATVAVTAGKMQVFCGDSHSRLFHSDAWGKFSFNSFSGATIAGLGSKDSTTGHPQIIRHLAQVPNHKTLFLMFGNVDIDFTFYRSSMLDPTITLDQFILHRVNSYKRFITSLLDDDRERGVLTEICVLGAHLTPVEDREFVAVTGPQISQPEEKLRAMASWMDLGKKARVARTLRLNDALEEHLPALDPRVMFVRIDRAMLDADGVTDARFRGDFLLDHHPNKAQALKLWVGALKTRLPDFAIRG